MGIDPFAALGVMDDAGQPVAATTGSDGIPTMSVSPSRKGGIDPFTALGVDSNETFDQAQPSAAAASPPSTGRGVAKNAAAGLVEGSQGVGNMILDPVGNFVGKPLATAAVFAHDALAPVFGGQRFPDDVRNMLLGDNVPQPVTRATDAAASAMGVPTPDEVPANGPSERYTRAGVAGAVQTAALAPGASVIAPLTGVGMGVGGQAGADVAPEWAKPMAGMAGGFAGGIGIPAGASFGRMVGGAVARKAGTDLNIGRRQDIGGIRPTNAQTQQTGEQLSEAIGPTGRQNITRSLADEQTAQELEAKLANGNLHPLEREQIEEQLKPLRAMRSVMVPGSEPTTAELANTAGAQDLEQAAKKVNAPAFVERNTQRNNARVGAIENAADAPDSVPSPPVAQGNPQTLGQVVTDRLRQIEADGQQNVASAKAGVQSNPLQDAGTEPISATGAKLRQTLKAAADPWIQAYRRAWAAVDPDGTWAIRSGPLRDVGEELASQVKPYSQTDGQTDALVNAARTISPTVKFSDLAQMRKAANAALARLTGERGYEPEVYRLGRVKGAIDSTIAASIDEKAKIDPGLGSRLQELADGHGANATSQRGHEWKTESGDLILSVDGHDFKVLRSSTDGQYVATVRDTGDVVTFRHNPDDLVTALKEKIARGDPDTKAARRADEPGQGNATRNGAVGSQAVPAENVALRAGANGSGSEPEGGRGGASGNSGVSSGATAGQGAAAQRPPARPASLVDFLISRGGIKNEGGDLNEDLQAIHHQMGGRLINNKSGMHPDYAREAAVEEGYLPQSADINTLKDALAEHARGNPTYRGADIAQQQEWEAGQRATRANAAFDAKLYDARDTVNTWAEQNGVRLSRQEQDDAAHLVATGVHVEDAMRSAVRDGEDRALQNNAQMNAFGQTGVPLAEHQATMDVTGSPRIQPNMTEENAATYAAANKATADYKERYRRGGVGNVLQDGRNHEDFRIAEGNVPRQVFTGNNVEPAEVDRFITAVGKDKAQEIGRDVLVNDLRSKNILNPDGDVNETKLGRWLSARSATLERFPELKKQFGDLKSAQATVNEAMAKDVADRKAFQDSVAGRIIGADPRNAVQKILSGPNPEANMRQLVDQIKDNPDAVASLKRMVTDYITEKHSSATPSTDGFDMLKADGLRRFIKQYKEPLRVLFGGQGLQNIEMIGADLRRQAGGPNALAGSQTAAHGARSARTGIGQEAGHANQTLMALLGEHLGSLLHGAGGFIGAAVGLVGGNRLNALKQAAINNKNDLTSFAMLHPEVAKALMEKADAKNTMSLAAKKRIGAAIRTAIMADMGSDGEQKK